MKGILTTLSMGLTANASGVFVRAVPVPRITEDEYVVRVAGSPVPWSPVIDVSPFWYTTRVSVLEFK